MAKGLNSVDFAKTRRLRRCASCASCASCAALPLPALRVAWNLRFSWEFHEVFMGDPPTIYPPKNCWYCCLATGKKGYSLLLNMAICFVTHKKRWFSFAMAGLKPEVLFSTRFINRHFLDLFRGMYPLVICYIAIENGHWNSEFSHKKMVDLSIVM